MDIRKHPAGIGIPVDISRRRFMIDYYELFSILLMHRARFIIVVSEVESFALRRIFSNRVTHNFTEMRCNAKDLFKQMRVLFSSAV